MISLDGEKLRSLRKARKLTQESMAGVCQHDRPLSPRPRKRQEKQSFRRAALQPFSSARRSHGRAHAPVQGRQISISQPPNRQPPNERGSRTFCCRNDDRTVERALISRRDGLQWLAGSARRCAWKYMSSSSVISGCHCTAIRNCSPRGISYASTNPSGA